MKSPHSLFLKAVLCLSPVMAFGQYGPLNPADLLKPLGESWPTFCGDYTCRHYSNLTQINQSNVKNLTLAWVSRITAGVPAPAGAGGGAGGFGGPGGGGGGRGGGATIPTIIGGEGPESTAGTSGARVPGSLLEVDGALYFSAPNNAWAVDARDGRVLWHYFWKTLGGNTIGNRGLGMYGSWLYMETADNHLVCLDAKTGKERWHKVIADLAEQYFSTSAPIVIGNHVLVGTGDDLDAPGYLTSFDPETGDVQWKHYDVPMKVGDPGLETWPSLDAAQHGGAQPWIPGSYDPETHLYIYGTGNPTPGYTNGGREGDNLYTCSLIALDVDTGKMKWYFQTSPHDTHDWDSTQIPMNVDAMFGGRVRKLVMQATRNGYFFVFDRVTGEHLLTAPFSAANWAKGIDAQGHPVRNPEKDPVVDGALVSGTNVGSTIWVPPAWYPDLGYFILRQNDAFAMYYLLETDPRGSMGLGGKEEDGVGSLGSYITAIDYKTGKVAWRRPSLPLPGGGGLLTTAGKLLFAGDGSSIVAYDPANGKPLWHSRIGATSNAPETYMLDGHQYLTVFADDSIFSFMIY
jgi:alcohol dehydrogenase (cytochrome c)